LDILALQFFSSKMAAQKWFEMYEKSKILSENFPIDFLEFSLL
jgi:hypothetical protein